MVLEAASKTTKDYGIELLDVMFKRVNYIDSVRKRVYDRMISERKRIAEEKRSTGEGRKAEILGRVQRELKEITSKAAMEAYVIRVRQMLKQRIYGETYSGILSLTVSKKTLGTNSGKIWGTRRKTHPLGLGFPKVPEGSLSETFEEAGNQVPGPKRGAPTGGAI